MDEGWKSLSNNKKIFFFFFLEAGHVVEKPLSGFKTLHGNKPYKTTYATIKRSCTSSENRRSNRSGRFLLPKQVQTVTKPRFSPMLCLFLMNI